MCPLREYKTIFLISVLLMAKTFVYIQLNFLSAFLFCFKFEIRSERLVLNYTYTSH